MHSLQEVQGLQLVHQLLQKVSQKVSTNVTVTIKHFYSKKNSCSFILDVEDIYLPFVAVGNVTDTDSIELPESDDGSSDAISTQPFPFGDSIQTTVFVRS